MCSSDLWFGDARPCPSPLPMVPSRFLGGAQPKVRALEQAHLVLMLPAPSARDEAYFPIRVFAEALGGGMSSRLFQEARERRGLAYAIDAYADCYQDGGVLGIYAGCAPSDAAELAKVAASELLALAQQIEPAELSRAKAQLKASLFMARESALARAEQSAGQVLLFDRLFTADDIGASIDAVDADQVRAAGQGLLSPGLAASAVLGSRAASKASDAFHQVLVG